MASAMAGQESDFGTRWQRADVYRGARKAPGLRGEEKRDEMREKGTSRIPRTVSGFTVSLEEGVSDVR